MITGFPRGRLGLRVIHIKSHVEDEVGSLDCIRIQPSLKYKLRFCMI